VTLPVDPWRTHVTTRQADAPGDHRSSSRNRFPAKKSGISNRFVKRLYRLRAQIPTFVNAPLTNWQPAWADRQAHR
jgi:hypothetical protein